jgi:hypothetical protein
VLVESELARRPGDPGLRLELAKILYFEGLEGGGEPHLRSKALFEDLQGEMPDDPLIVAYLGSLEMLEGARSLLPWRILSGARAGLARLDEAVESAPLDPEIRFLRGMACFNLPGFFAREETAREDLARVAREAEAAAASGALEPDLGAAALFHHARLLEREGEDHQARLAFERAARLAPDSPAGKDARRELGGRR